MRMMSFVFFGRGWTFYAFYFRVLMNYMIDLINLWTVIKFIYEHVTYYTFFKYVLFHLIYAEAMKRFDFTVNNFVLFNVCAFFPLCVERLYKCLLIFLYASIISSVNMVMCLPVIVYRIIMNYVLFL